jgi:MFS family permease
MSIAAPGPCDVNLALRPPRGRAGIRPHARCLDPGFRGLAFIDGSVINVALPALDRDLEPGPDGLAWLINAYLLALTALILLGGAAGDRYGRRRLLFLPAPLVFGVGALSRVLLH